MGHLRLRRLLPRRCVLRLVAGAIFAALLVRPGVALALDHVILGTDWKAEAEHGGYYQAIAAGIYRKYGLDVTIRQGGPQVNQAQLMAAGRLDFEVAPNSFIALNFVKEGVPVVAVAAMFQKDPSVLIAHPGEGDASFAALKGKPIMISADTRVGFWLFLKAKFGYSDSQIRPYNFTVAPFIANKKAIQQGYLTSEPFLIERHGVKPVVLLLANAGYSSYASVLETSKRLVTRNPGLVQRFINASIEGWYSYLDGNPAPGDALIKKDNPDMTDALLKYGRSALKRYGVLESGDAKALGIGTMSAARWAAFFHTMAKEGLYPRNMEYRKAFTLRFVNKRVGLADKNSP